MAGLSKFEVNSYVHYTKKMRHKFFNQLVSSCFKVILPHLYPGLNNKNIFSLSHFHKMCNLFISNGIF